MELFVHSSQPQQYTVMLDLEFEYLLQKGLVPTPDDPYSNITLQSAEIYKNKYTTVEVLETFFAARFLLLLLVHHKIYDNSLLTPHKTI